MQAEPCRTGYSRVLEGSLEWTQVLPEYRGRGFGKVLAL